VIVLSFAPEGGAASLIPVLFCATVIVGTVADAAPADAA
jgi:hypothetical protein